MSNCTFDPGTTEQQICRAAEAAEAAAAAATKLAGEASNDLGWFTARVDAILPVATVVAAAALLLLVFRIFWRSDWKEVAFSFGGVELSGKAAIENASILVSDLQQEFAVMDQRLATIAKILKDSPNSKGFDPEMLDFVMSSGMSKAEEDDKHFAPPDSEKPKTLPGLSIFWVDDSKDEIAFERHILEELGHSIDWVGSTKEAWDVLEHGAKYDVIISDMKREDHATAGISLYRYLSGKSVAKSADGADLPRGFPIIGKDTKFVIYSTRLHAARFEKERDGDGNAFLTDSFATLRARLRWLQHHKNSLKVQNGKES